MALMFSLGWILLFGAIYALSKGDSKRLLLNDPDVLNDRMNRLENLVHMLNTTLKQVIVENQQQQQQIEQQTIEIKQHKHEMDQQKHEMEQQSQEIQQLLLHNKHGYGATYIRWGRKTCPGNSTELVYSGYAGGGFYQDYGAAADQVCLPPDPNFGKTSGTIYVGRMYGAEFFGNFFASGAHGEDVPCSVCRSTHATSTIMIPGKSSCYHGWTMEYHGYLASGCYCDKGATSFVCIDIQPEFIIGGQSAQLGVLFQEVLAKCGSLKCPPYKENQSLTCVVCSK